MCKLILKCMLCISTISFLSTNAKAAPVINSTSGVFAHGQSILIYGSDFGTKSPATPARFEDFEETNSLRTGGDVWADNWWGQGISYFRTSEHLSNRVGVYCGRTSDMSIYRLGGPGTAGFTLPSSTEYIYVYRKEYYNYDVHPVGIIYNHKNFRVWSSDMRNNFTINMGNQTYGTAHRDGQHSYGTYTVDVPINKWNTFEFALKNSTLNGHDGKIRAWYNSQFSIDILHPSQYTTPSMYANLDSIQTRYDAYPNPLTIVFHEHMADNEPKPPVGSYVWVDDLYIDNTWARVVIGDQPTYDACSNREIEIPSAWSENLISIRVNQGSFRDGDQVYLFVVDADGNVSEGYPITIGQSYGQAEDINQDGSVDINDVQLVVDVILGKVENSRADVNGDGSVTISDAQEVVNEII